MDLRKTALRLRPSVLAVSALSALAASLLLAAAALAAPAQGISVVRSPASGAHSLAANPDANRLYILSSSGPPKYSPVTSVVALDASSHSVVGVADALGILPYDVAVDAGRGRVFATNHDGLAVIDASTTKLQRWATLPPNVDLTSSVAVDPSSGRVYVASDLPSPVINVIDPANWKVSQQIKMPGGLTRGLVVNPATNRLYAVTTRTTEAAAISAVDIGTNEVIDLPQVGQTTAAPALDVAHNRLYLGRWHAQVSALDATTYDEVGTSAPLIDDPSERVAALGVDPDLQHVYAIYGQHLVVLDATTATLAEIARYDLPHSIPPDDVVPSRPLVVNTRTHRVYWTQDGDDSSLGFFQDTDGRAPCITSEAGCEATPAPAATATPTPPVSDVVGPTEIPTVPPATPMPLPSSDVAFATDTPVPASTPDPNCTPIATDGGDGDSSPTCGMVGGIVQAEDGQQ
ncbi:MAG: hypothetical protein JOY61_04610, partial [Chloroflexi bacterium]|nr:hypothetical protein [Chloroflexota bacterium]